ncbi:MAG: sugar ABC transporter permease [Candidatus Bathyarchaeia archaeon]
MRESFAAYAFLLPALLVGIVFVILPIVVVFPMSLTDWDLITGRREFIGFENYIYLFNSYKFYRSIVNTFYFAGIKVPLDLVLSLLIAVMLDKAVKGIKIFRIAFFAPVVTPLVAAAMVWIWLYDPSLGAFNYILELFGFKPIRWLHDPHWAMPAIILFSLWKGLGYNIIIFLAGLQTIPQHIVEAAMVDGANSRQIFFRVTLPLLSPVIFFVLVVGIINAFKLFTQISVMTPTGGPLYSTATLVFYIYELAFVSGKLGRASAAAVVLFGMILSLTLVQRKLGRKYVIVE